MATDQLPSPATPLTRSCRVATCLDVRGDERPLKDEVSRSQSESPTENVGEAMDMAGSESLGQGGTCTAATVLSLIHPRSFCRVSTLRPLPSSHVPLNTTNNAATVTWCSLSPSMSDQQGPCLLVAVQ
ncbi:hypothetical protein IG631_15524 [Alternaria alternata]|nr:hypothetical protein IG631_15524 [Alternaria alternata]